MTQEEQEPTKTIWLDFDDETIAISADLRSWWEAITPKSDREGH